MNDNKPAASGAAPALPTPWKTVIDATGEPVQVWRAFQMRDYARAALASREASPAPLTNERAAFDNYFKQRAICLVMDPVTIGDVVEKYMFQAWEARAALASPQVAPAPVPDGFALVPIQMTKAMEYVTEQGDWEWSDLLAAAANPVQVAPQDDARDAIRREAFEQAAKEPRAYAEMLEKGGWGNRFPDELCAIFNASTNMAERIRALADAPAAKPTEEQGS